MGSVNLAKLSANGQITVPMEVRRFLGVGPGDKLLFTTNAQGEIIVSAAPSLSPEERKPFLTP